jgi:hypothetical protein
MLTKTLIGAAALCTGALLQSGCAGESANPSGSMPQHQGQPQALDTAQLLAMAQAPSETADPETVGAGALTVADLNDETSDPLPVG